MDKDYRAKEYHNTVWKNARDATNSAFADKRSWVGDIFTGIFTGYIIPIILQKASGETMTNPLIYFLVVVTSSILGAGIFILIVFGLNGFWLTPAQMYREEKAKANHKTWRDVDVVPFNISRVSGYQGVGFSIISDKFPIGENKEITIYGVVSKILWIRQKTETIDLQQAPFEIPMLHKNGDIYEKGKYIVGRKEKDDASIVVVSLFDENNFWIPKDMKTPYDDIKLDSDIPFRVAIQIDGKIDIAENCMDKFIVYCDVIYENKNMKIKIFERFPEYEN